MIHLRRHHTHTSLLPSPTIHLRRHNTHTTLPYSPPPTIHLRRHNTRTIPSPSPNTPPNQVAFDALPGEEEIDARLAAETTNDLRALDGVAMHGWFKLPKQIRAAIAAADTAFTTADPHALYGRGSLKTAAAQAAALAKGAGVA